MNIKTNTVLEYHKLIKDKKISIEKLISHSLAAAHSPDLANAVVSVLDDAATSKARDLSAQNPLNNNNPLYGIPYAVKDNFNIINTKTTASSKILQNFTSKYTATVIDFLNDAGAIPVAKVVLDELGMGGHGLYATSGYVYNPWDKTRISGGSSSGSVVLVASGAVPFALGTDTGDSVRTPAAYCGVVGWKPSYGLFSRAGVIPFAPSLDTVGVITRSIADAALLTNCLSQYDDKDFTLVHVRNKPDYLAELTGDVRGQKWCYIRQVHKALPAYLQEAFQKKFLELQRQGVTVEVIDFREDLLNALLPIYNVISYAESISTHSNLTGINFGVRQEGEDYRSTMVNSRSKGFGREVQKRFIIGSYCLKNENQERLFFKAKQIRRLVTEECKQIYKKYDGIFTPAAWSIAPKIEKIAHLKPRANDARHVADNVLLIANLMGSPSLSLPIGFEEGMPFSIGINTKPFDEITALNMGLAIEKITGYKNMWIRSKHAK